MQIICPKDKTEPYNYVIFYPTQTKHVLLKWYLLTGALGWHDQQSIFYTTKDVVKPINFEQLQWSRYHSFGLFRLKV